MTRSKGTIRLGLDSSLLFLGQGTLGRAGCDEENGVSGGLGSKPREGGSMEQSGELGGRWSPTMDKLGDIESYFTILACFL